MKLLKEIENLFENLPKYEQKIFKKTFKGDFKDYKHNEKIILFNILLWRNHLVKEHSKDIQETFYDEDQKF